MAQQIAYGLAALRIPYPRGLIVGSCDDAPPVRAETGRVDQALMTHWFADGLAAFRIPDPRGLVPRCGDDASPVRAEIGRDDPFLMTHRFADRVAAVYVPQPRGLVIESGDDSPSVRTETNVRICGKKVDGFPIGRRHPILMSQRFRPRKIPRRVAQQRNEILPRQPCVS